MKYKKIVITGCDRGRFFSDLHVSGEANEANEKLFLLLRLDRLLGMCSTSGIVTNCLGGGVSRGLKIARHINVVFGKYWCHVCICRE